MGRSANDILRAGNGLTISVLGDVETTQQHDSLLAIISAYSFIRRVLGMNKSVTGKDRSALNPFAWRRRPPILTLY